MFISCAPDDQEPYRVQGRVKYLLKVGKGIHVGVAYGRFANHGLRSVSHSETGSPCHGHGHDGLAN